MVNETLPSPKLKLATWSSILWPLNMLLVSLVSINLLQGMREKVAEDWDLKNETVAFSHCISLSGLHIINICVIEESQFVQYLENFT